MTNASLEDVIKLLVDNGAPTDHATLYANAFIEYREASENIAQYGAIVQHPRTGNPVENPYLKVRDRAHQKLLGMRRIKADFLW